MSDPVDDLYGLPVADFTAARDALAKALRAGGHKDDAIRVKALRRPTLAVWAVNRAMRSSPALAQTLIAAHATLAAARAALLEETAVRAEEASRAAADRAAEARGAADAVAGEANHAAQRVADASCASPTLSTSRGLRPVAEARQQSTTYLSVTSAPAVSCSITLTTSSKRGARHA